jgi:4-aminobutyrate aminotransferase
MTDDLLIRHRAVMPAWMPVYYGDQALEIVSGSGRRLTDASVGPIWTSSAVC